MYAFDTGNDPLYPAEEYLELVWIYLLITLMGSLVLLRRWRDPGLLILGALALSSLTYQVGLFLSMGIGYRLEMPSVVIGLLTLVACLHPIITGRLKLPGIPR